jgi:type IV pilus assembly protein PilX
MTRRIKRQQGVVLVVALVLMAVIAISSAAAIRNIITQDQVGLNQRLQVIARQSAESMLRYCETALVVAVPNGNQQALIAKIQPKTGDTYQWETLSNWSVGGAMVFDLPAGSVLPSYAAGRRPQCMVEQTGLSNAEPQSSGGGSATAVVMLVTARGFSPDYQENAQGVLTQGAQAWLQSTVHVRPELANL